MNSFVPSFTGKLLELLGENMIGLLHLGSNEHGDGTAFSDVDFVLLVKTMGIEELMAIRKAICNLGQLIDMPILQKGQIPADPDLFQLGTQGCYFVHVLKNASTVYGVNLFQDYPEPNSQAVRMSLFRKISEYTLATQRAFVESNRERSVYQNYQLNSRLLKSVKDLLWLMGDATAHLATAVHAVLLLKSKLPTFFMAEEWRILQLQTCQKIF
jgi:hypothetical protein